MLQWAGHDTVSASTLAEARALINSKDEKFELVFADIELGNHKEGGLTTGKLVGGRDQACGFLHKRTLGD